MRADSAKAVTQTPTNDLTAIGNESGFELAASFFSLLYLKVGFRLASGEKSPTSANQTLDNSFSTKNINLDKAYVDWRIPRGNSSLRLTGGKFVVPFMKTQQVWDSDVTVEGIAEKLAHKFGNTKLELILGLFIVEEFGPSATDSGSDDIYLLAYQGIVSQKLGDHSNAKVAVALYDYNDLRGNITSFGATGNTLDGNGRFQTNYRHPQYSGRDRNRRGDGSSYQVGWRICPKYLKGR